jgi:hypothetical protein
MKYIIETLDARHNGWGIWKYRIRFKDTTSNNIRSFHTIRRWLWECYGPGFERDLYTEWQTANLGYEEAASVWSWHSEYNSRKFIYLRDDATMSSVILQLGPN